MDFKSIKFLDLIFTKFSFYINYLKYRFSFFSIEIYRYYQSHNEMSNFYSEVILPHVVLLGDSVFDNAVYVEAGHAVIDRLRLKLPMEWKSTLLACDGSVVSDVISQFSNLPLDVSHIVISCGGNDALGQLGIMQQPVATIFEALQHLKKMQSLFISDYVRLLDNALDKVVPQISVCTIYDSVPGLDREILMTLALFNDVIIRSAIERRLPLLDFRLLLNHAEDYSRISSIEPSEIGSEKIAQAICNLVLTSSSEVRSSQVFGCNRR